MEVVKDKKSKSFLVDLIENGLPKEVIGPEGIEKYLDEYANMMALSMRDIKHSADIREIMQNNESKPERYKVLVNSAKCHILASVMLIMVKQCEACANGLLTKATKNVPFMPAAAFPDNPFGAFCLDAVLGLIDYVGHDGKELKKQELEIAKDGTVKERKSGGGVIIVEE